LILFIKRVHFVLNHEGKCPIAAVPVTDPASFSTVEEPPKAKPLTEFERRMSAVSADLLGVAALPRSYGEIYGLLFASAQPLSFGDIRGKLDLSKGSVSQGLKVLKNLGAIRLVSEPESPRDYYAPETELRQLVTSLLRETINPQLTHGSGRLAEVRAALRSEPLASPERKLLSSRCEKLEAWHKKTSLLLPILSRFFG
jgi:DNA-binding transcriptional regulator GbsR (MarR family)